MKHKSIKPNLQSQINHDIITPVTCILGLLSCLQETSIDTLQASYLRDIEKSVQQLLHVPNHIKSMVDSIDKTH